MRDLWRKRVKNDWLRLKLAGKDDKSIADILDKRYDNFLKRIGRIKQDGCVSNLHECIHDGYRAPYELHGAACRGGFRYRNATVPGWHRCCAHGIG